jgi:Flp pilus assembly protein TadB
MAIDFKDFIKRVENAELRQQLRELEQDEQTEQEALKLEQLKLNNELKRARLEQIAKPTQKGKADKTILTTLIFCLITCIAPLILLTLLILLYN